MPEGGEDRTQRDGTVPLAAVLSGHPTPPIQRARAGAVFMPGRLLAGRYRITTFLAEGGMGEVYVAEDLELNERVAVKTVHPDLATHQPSMDRFRREIHLARQVTHPNVCRIFDVFHDTSVVGDEATPVTFLTMELLLGESLEGLLRRGPLSVEAALPLVRQMAEGLGAAHRAGVVHRDLKPANILLVPAEGGSRVVLTDFGLAREWDHAGETLSQTGDVVGTPAYMAPEQVAARPTGPATDIYALGLVMYEMVTGHLPFEGDGGAFSIALRRLKEPPRPPRMHVPALDPAWNAVILRCLKRDPEARFRSASEILPALEGGRMAPAAREVRRRWIGAGVAALVLLLGAGAFVGRFRIKAVWAKPAPSRAPRHAVVVLPLADETGLQDLAWSGSGLAEMLSGQLSEDPGLRIPDTLRVARILRDLKVPEGAYDAHALRQVGDLLDADRVVSGSLRRSGSSLRADLRIFSLGPEGAKAGKTIVAETTDARGIFHLLELLGPQLRRELGAELDARVSSPGLGTGSVAAASAYREGRNHMLVGDFLHAAPAFERAVAEDPHFAEAFERLSESFQRLGYEDKALDAARRALQAVRPDQARLSQRIGARFALLGGKPAEAERIYRALVERFPNDTETLLDLAAAQTARGDGAQAVVTLKRVTELDRGDPRGWFQLGRNAILLGDSAKGVGDYLVKALALQTQLHNEEGQAEVLNAMGVAHQQMGDNAQALERYTASAEIRRRLGSERALAASLNNRARVYLDLSRFKEAEADLESARKLYEKVGDQAGLAEAMNDVGVLREHRGDYLAALEAYQAALRLLRNLGDEGKIAQSYDNIGYIYFIKGAYDDALVYWQQTLDLRRKLGDKTGIVLSTQNMGFLQIAQGQWNEAVKSFMIALDGARAIDFKAGMAVSHGNLGLLHQYEGRYATALASYDEALAILKALEDRRGLVEFTLKKAQAQLEAGSAAEAKALLDSVASQILEARNPEQTADYEVLLGQWQWAQQDKAAARKAFQMAVEKATESGSRTALLRARIAQGAALPEPSQSLARLGATAQEAEALGDALLRILAWEALAKAQLASRRTEAAGTSTSRALEVAERAGWRMGLYRLYALQGRILAARGDAGASATQFQRSREDIARLREGMNPDARRGFDALPEVRASSDPGRS